MTRVMNQLNQFDAVIFDMDGLLVDSEKLWSIHEKEFLRRRGKTWDHNIQNKLIGMRMDDFLRGMMREYELTEDYDSLRQEILDGMTRLISEQLIPMPGASELLAYLTEQGIPCAIASSSALVIIDAVVKSQKWENIFVAHTSGDEVPLGKPNPDVYIEAARRLGVDPRNCLALEDSPTGARAAVAAGMTCYAVPDPFHAKPEAFATITPYVFASLHGVLAHLKSPITASTAEPTKG